MKVSTLLLILADVVPLLERDGLIDTNGDFVTPTAAQWTKLATDVNNVLTARGVKEPAQVAQILTLIPLVLSIAGVK